MDNFDFKKKYKNENLYYRQILTKKNIADYFFSGWGVDLPLIADKSA